MGDSHLDTIRMLNYGFDNFESIQAVSKGEILGEIRVKQGKAKDTVTLSAGGGVAVIVPKGTEKDALEIRMNVPDALYAPLTKGQEVATVSILHQGQELGTGLLCADVDIERSVLLARAGSGGMALEQDRGQDSGLPVSGGDCGICIHHDRGAPKGAEAGQNAEKTAQSSKPGKITRPREISLEKDRDLCYTKSEWKGRGILRPGFPSIRNKSIRMDEV